ncbi:transcription factor DYT1 [Amaranthus tricolor]|uniref:transcription factor DYT1 n=1 Tax=Amaranthus tricolor TaxID=29722 RepID=UPI002587A171|nr:transcription factor DYT1 [Amaranthus tricolor]
MMEFSDHPFNNNELSMEEEEEENSIRGRSLGMMRKKKNNNGGNNDDSRFKSKNLDAERRRRAKLGDRLLQLRALVPIITNMTKAYIIKDAITYIEVLDGQVSELKDELLELGNSTPPPPPPPLKDETKPDLKHNFAAQDINNFGIQPEVKVITYDYNKLWIKVVYEKKFGGFTKLVEAITRLGLEFNDTNYITSKEAAVVTSCIEGMSDDCLDVEETKEMLMTVISSI